MGIPHDNKFANLQQRWRRKRPRSPASPAARACLASALLSSARSSRKSLAWLLMSAVFELLRNSKDKRARKLAKKRLGTFGRAKRKVDDLQRVIAESRRTGLIKRFLFLFVKGDGRTIAD